MPGYLVGDPTADASTEGPPSPEPERSQHRLRGDWRGLSDVFDDIGENPDRRHDSYDVFGARLTWLPSNANWSLALWGRNLTDKAYTINVGPGQPNVNQLNFMYGHPLSYGVTFIYTL